eukprot:CAMPEP_0185020478 /NCGR_PEP_ID=MMETSP1103-20130426/3082_1 /TAXON_ID=36769 /ORGANISM="Paraphysomonas bandaiensis, Strain Caron Lab Isolate" /LENGTH=729 /DNA_ID=CAMNT_0027551401 /DNA_START=116 /DNA_END=2305 /DNA_ORIENTATION=+
MKVDKTKTRRRNLVVDILDHDAESNLLDAVKSWNDFPIEELQARRAAVDAFKGIFFVESLESLHREQQLSLLLKALKRESHRKGDCVISEGDDGVKVYVIEKGELSVTIKGRFKRKLYAGTLFGELALLYNAPRSATVRCITDCDFWVLDKSTFLSIQHMKVTDTAKSVLQRSQWLMNCPELSLLRPVQMSRLLESLQPESYDSGQVIYQIGHCYDKIILIESGTAIVMYDGPDASMLEEDEKDRLFGIVRPHLNSTTLRNNTRLRDSLRVSQRNRNDILPVLSECSSACENDDGVNFLYPVSTLVEGCVFGLPILQVQSSGQDNGIWKCADMPSSQNEVVCPVRIVAEQEVDCLTFTVETFKHLFGPMLCPSEPSNVPILPPPPLPTKKLQSFDPDEISVVKLLGKGGYGTVVLGECENQLYAVKFMSKYEITNDNQIRHVRDERILLASLNSPFIVKLHGTCQTQSAIAFVMEYVDRGDLWSSIHENVKYEDAGLPMDMIKFYTTCIVLALHHIHQRNISFRDLKPENVMIDSKGYLRLIDFGLAKRIPYEKVDCMGEKRLLYKTFTLCGTPEYLAPENVFGMGNDRSVDLWALGILMFEMFAMNTPFVDEDDPDNVDKIFKNISRVKTHGMDISAGVSRDDPSMPALNLIHSLMRCDPTERLGFRANAPLAILDHEFLSMFDTEAVETLDYEPDYIPPDPTEDSCACIPSLRFQKYTGDNCIFNEF